MTVINTNSGAMRAQNASRIATLAQSTAMERLSSGKRINSAKDDAAGLAISNSMTAQIRGMSQGIRNANDGISLAQSAEGALGEITSILQRVRELSVQSSSETYSPDDRKSLQLEVTALTAQISDILTNNTFNGITLFRNAAPTVDDPAANPPTVSNAVSLVIQTGANEADKVDFSIQALDLTAITGAAGPPVVPPLDITGPDGSTARGKLTMLDDALGSVSAARADLGATQSRLESIVNVQTSNVTNLSDARSRIEDTDYSTETTQLAKAQILTQASQAMLAQANQSAQAVMNLLRQ